MKPNEIIELMDEIAYSLPQRVSGNEESAIIAKRIQTLAITDRNNLIQALQKLLSFRMPPSKRAHEGVSAEVGIWMALDIGKRLVLPELKPDIEALLKDVCEEKALRPVHAPAIERYLESFNKMTPKISTSHSIGN